ncbi:MAG: NAD-dependent epimerase/dehydratase family protein [Cyclobacteriaceae bacterium]|nr:NAD-dependent epimerase/dehydratase family protein [Cyclobacteriaceae bacterium]MDH4296965.1 NAD-dependent epimerase/dehydratase family protein [Cyclobacteriaceae bacterium]MDH5250462.1 NAD-dependent epimerase/dehydratase family protein [Cyclobacteriaceae bacterium]
MQTILGANGIIGQELSKNLGQYTSQIRQVSRNPKRVNATDTLLQADLLNYEQTEQAVAGSEIVYLVAGLKYDISVWRDQWPKVMKNVLDACKKHNSKLVFFDNVYAYGKVDGIMTEETPFNPNSRKGEVRASIATMLLDEIKSNNLQGMIVRAADFYGPGAILSLTHAAVHERLKQGKGAQWIGDPKTIHTFTYTPDAGKTVAVLGNTPSAFNQTWHALTSAERMTGEDYVRIACKTLNIPFKGIQTLPKFGVRILGLFMPVLRESVEMIYQFENDYIFDSSKFERAFSLKATTYQEGIKASLSYGS